MQGGMFEIDSQYVRCTLSAYGAAISALQVRDRHGRWTSVALSPTDPSGDIEDPSLAGRTVAPCCGRVRDGEIWIDGEEYSLTRNEGPNHIHGGPHGAAFQRWAGERVSPGHVRFTLRLPEGLDGYPGDRALSADYTLSGNSLRVTYSAVSDRPTWIDFTNHVYWDLGGRFDGSALEQRLEVAAGEVVYNGSRHVPLEIRKVDTAFDFASPAKPAEKLRLFADHPQIIVGRGYNNAFIVSPERVKALGFAARLSSDATGITMTLRTDQPAIVFYSGGFLGADTQLENGRAVPGCALALEAQGVPDPFHLPGASPTILRPGEAFKRYIEWTFE